MFIGLVDTPLKLSSWTINVPVAVVSFCPLTLPRSELTVSRFNVCIQRVSSGPVLVRECSSASVFSHRVTASPTSLLRSSQSSSGGSLSSTLDCNLVVVDLTTNPGLQDKGPGFCSPHVPSPQPELDTDDAARVRFYYAVI